MISKMVVGMIESVAATIEANAELLTELDRAIGDGDHGVNMQRGLKALVSQRDKLADLSFSKALQRIGTSLVMNIGGASGPLYGSLCIVMGKTAEAGPIDLAHLGHIISEGVAAVKKRGKSDVGQKTMLDVLVPVADVLKTAISDGASPADMMVMVRRAAASGLESTRDMMARKGRASFLGERSVGHLDPGAKSSQLIAEAICRSIEEQASASQSHKISNGCVGIAIVSHSADVARGTAQMVRQMVGDEVPLAWCGGNPDRGLGTNVAAIKEAIETVWNPSGVVILVDLGGAETNSEMAIEMLPEDRQSRVVICNAPIVEGAIMAATESAGGGTLQQVRDTAEELGVI